MTNSACRRVGSGAVPAQRERERADGQQGAGEHEPHADLVLLVLIAGCRSAAWRTRHAAGRRLRPGSTCRRWPQPPPSAWSRRDPRSCGGRRPCHRSPAHRRVRRRSTSAPSCAAEHTSAVAWSVPNPIVYTRTRRCGSLLGGIERRDAARVGAVRQQHDDVGHVALRRNGRRGRRRQALPAAVASPSFGSAATSASTGATSGRSRRWRRSLAAWPRR